MQVERMEIMANKFLDNDGLLYLWNLIKSKFVAKESGKGLSTNDYTTTEKNKLEGIATGANKYIHPSYTAKSSGLYKVTVDSTGHVSGASAVAKSDITGLGIPGSDTTYNVFAGATTSPAAEGSSGLVPAPPAGGILKVLTGAGSWENMEMAVENPNDLAYLLVNLNIGSNRVSTVRIPEASSTQRGLMTKEDKAKLDAFQAASNYALKTDITAMYKYRGSVATSSALPTSGKATGDVYNIEAASSYGPAGTNVAWDGTKWDALGGLFEITAITNAEIDAICV